MNAFENDIVNMFDEQNMSVNDIAAELNGEIDPSAIKMVLSMHSHKFQKDTVEASKSAQKGAKPNAALQPVTFPGAPASDDNLLNASDKAKIKQTLLTLMNHSENDMVRARLAIYLHEEVTGRNERRIKMNTMPNVQMNIRALNEQIGKARELIAAKMKQVGESPMMVIDVS